MNQAYKGQVDLLLQLLPWLRETPELLIHGGTAINLFVREMPRLSVDIDLTYRPLDDRETSLSHIVTLLNKLKVSITRKIPDLNVKGPQEKGIEYKLLIEQGGKTVKVEVNTVIRGIIDEAIEKPLCSKAQEAFDTFTENALVPLSQLWGGKLVAALDRQHPRDVFDLKDFFEIETIDKDIKKGLLFILLSSNRPLHELLSPGLQDQRHTFDHQFSGMTL